MTKRWCSAIFNKQCTLSVFVFVVVSSFVTSFNIYMFYNTRYTNFRAYVKTNTSIRDMTHRDVTALRLNLDSAEILLNSTGSDVTSKEHTFPGENDNRTILILQWGDFTGKYFLSGSKVFSACKHTNCAFTRDTTKLNSADAVLLHVKKLNKFKLPPSRSANQLWIALNVEPPTKRNIQVLSSVTEFNATSTYHKNSDIPFPYGFTKKRLESEDEQWGGDVGGNKTKLVAWVVTD